MLANQEFKFSVAPMMEWTDSFCRLFHGAMSRRARLYTEMVTAAALIHGPRAKLLALYRESNLNVGCPSDRVQDGASAPA